MEIYDQSGQRLDTYDPALGTLREETHTVHHEAVEGVEEVSHYEIEREYPNGGRDVRKVIDQPGVQAQEAYDEQITVSVYVPYTEEELAEQQRRREEQEREMLEMQQAAEREQQEREQRLVDIEDALIELAGLIAEMEG